jgi:membrane protease YdiL (CAAX protease family)
MLFGWLHLIFFGVVVPVVAVRTQSMLLRLAAAPDRIAFYRGAILQLIVMTAISVFVARREHIELFPRRAPDATHALIGFVVLIALIVLLRPRWKRAVLEGDRAIALFTPMTRDERLLWLFISLFAGVSEEITWRGVQTVLLERVTGSLWIAIIACALMFGISHAVQGFESIAIIAAIALVFHGLVLLTGSLYVAMAVHALYDAIVGFTYAKLARQYGYTFGVPAANYEHLR